MNSTMELMEKKTPLTKINRRKRGMTLVEVMAAMAILSILFVGISGFMINITKTENRSNKILETTNYLKAAVLLFNKGDANVDDYSSGEVINGVVINVKPICFNDLEEMKMKIINMITDESDNNNEYRYSIKITCKNIGGSKYKVTATMDNGKIIDTKVLYVVK